LRDSFLYPFALMRGVHYHILKVIVEVAVPPTRPQPTTAPSFSAHTA
jgi:hypothetical protein